MVAGYCSECRGRQKRPHISISRRDYLLDPYAHLRLRTFYAQLMKGISAPCLPFGSAVHLDPNGTQRINWKLGDVHLSRVRFHSSGGAQRTDLVTLKQHRIAV